MFTNFLKIAYRNLLRNLGFSAINITGLAVGMAAAILILLWIQSELSYDQFHAKKDRIYEVWNDVVINGERSTWNSISEPAAKAIEESLPEVERAVRAKGAGTALFSVGDKKIMQTGAAVDTGFLQVFSFPMLKGNLLTALNDAYSIVITESMAKGLFGNEDPIGKVVRVNNTDNFTVKGVLKDLPHNTRFEFDYLLPWEVMVKSRTSTDLGWDDNSVPTYVLLKENADPSTAAQKMKVLKQKYSKTGASMKWEMFLYPLERWRLYSSFSDGVEDDGGRSGFVKLFGIISAFILLIACINFMNLSTARSEKRAKEVGIRKVSGARKSSLVGQFIAESVFMAFLAGMVALVIVLLCLPAYNRLTEKELFIDFTDGYTWAAFMGFIVFTGLLAGSYPAFFLSSFKPVNVLKGAFKKTNALITPRKALVVLQFSFTIMLIICTIVVKQQIDHARNRKMGYNKDNLVYHFLTGDLAKNYELIKNELIHAGVARSVTKTNSPLTERWSDGWGQSWEGKDPNFNPSFDRYMADDRIGATAGLEFIQGRDFDLKKFPTDSTGLIINESALKIMNFKDAIGKKVSDLGTDYHIIGVIKDFILTSPYEPANPLLLCGAKSSFLSFNVLQIKLNGRHSTAESLKTVEAIFKKYNPDYPFDIRFVDEAYEENFEAEQKQGTLAALFSGLAILISCLGLLGLAAYMAENRIREIGVRKVLGASVTGITVLLSKDFIRLVIISFIIAAPLAYWSMSKWLSTYAYRVEISWWVFAFAGCLSVLIALLTISFQSIKAAMANPVKNLRVE